MVPPSFPGRPEACVQERYIKRVGGLGASTLGPATEPPTAKKGKGLFPIPKQRSGSLLSWISNLSKLGTRLLISKFTTGPSGPFRRKEGPSSPGPILKSQRYRTPTYATDTPSFVIDVFKANADVLNVVPATLALCTMVKLSGAATAPRR